METFSTENEELFSEIAEMVEYKNRMKGSMDILEGVL